MWLAREGEADEGSSSWTDGLGPLIFQTLIAVKKDPRDRG